MEPPLPHWLPDCRTREYCREFRFRNLGTKQTCIPFTTTGLTRKACPTNRSYSRIVESFDTNPDTAPENSLIPHIQRIGDTEIDILIEDREYFVFVEAKNVPEGKKAKFEKTGGVHQLVRQYLQGKLLEKMISKTFALATIGVNGRAGCGNRIERPGGTDAESSWRNRYHPQRGGSSLALNVSGKQSPSLPASRSGRVLSRFVQKYTLRVAHLEQGGINLDFAVEDDVLPSAEHTHEGDQVGETQSIVAAPPQGNFVSIGFEKVAS